jgi:capsular polysaccharide export protein
VVAGGASILLTDKENLRELSDGDQAAPAFFATRSAEHATKRAPFLRIPPFPGARVDRFSSAQLASLESADLADEIRRLRVGGTFWGARPELPEGCVLVRSSAALEFARTLAAGQPTILWDPTSSLDPPGVIRITEECDPWHMLSKASALVAEAEDEVRLIAVLLGTSCFDFDPRTRQAEPAKLDIPTLLAKALGSAAFENPFTGEPMHTAEAITLCGFWRRLIDSNRDIAGGFGFAFWKQAHVAPLLWGGSAPFQFLRSAQAVKAGSSVAVWRAKSAPAEMTVLARKSCPLIEVEDGFLRSSGLGADCIPPLSITVDRMGAYFDPSQPSELETLLQTGAFEDSILERARELRQQIVDAGIGKYERGVGVLDRPGRDRRHILVPGQVEDDRAVQAGGCGLVSNLELLRKVREQEPDSYILYKPHPDVLAGHRRGAISDRACLEFADEIVGELPIASLIAMADEVHVNTSLAGFEALLRDKPVTTYGVPFYAGWGLTRDLGPVPIRRTARRSIDELAAATLLLYPRYLDPVTGLPCPAEIVVARLSACEERSAGFIVGMRRLQGKLIRRLRSLVQ